MSRLQRLLLIRHAATDMRGTFCGQSDPPLNETGRVQAAALALRVRSCSARRLYCSDLRRAQETADALAAAWSVPVETKRTLREISFGDWEGKRWSEVCGAGPDITAIESSPELCAPGGETFACFRARVLRGLTEILAECNGQLVAIVTHLGVIRVVLKELASESCAEEPQQRIDYGAAYSVRVDSNVLERLRS